jgi:DNA-binding transcriptional LysR family regulator
MDSWDDLRLLLAVHRAGTLSAAAPLLGVDQSTVSRRLSSLGRTLGTPLLERREGHYQLTAAGTAALQRAERVEQEIQALQLQLDRLNDRAGGSVRLSVPDGFGVALLAPRLWEFHRDNPGVELVLMMETSVVNLVRREADLAVRFVRPTQHELVVRRIARIGFGPYASDTYLSRRPRRAGFAPEEDVVLYDTAGQSPEGEWLLAHLPRARVRIRVRSPLVVQAAAVAGAGVGMLSTYLGAHPALKPLLATPPVMRDAFLVVHRSLARVERIRAVSDFVLRCLGS